MLDSLSHFGHHSHSVEHSVHIAQSKQFIYYFSLHKYLKRPKPSLVLSTVKPIFCFCRTNTCIKNGNLCLQNAFISRTKENFQILFVQFSSLIFFSRSLFLLLLKIKRVYILIVLRSVFVLTKESS